MIDIEQAREMVAARVSPANDQFADGNELVIVDESTIERDWGWVFFYTSRMWLETGDFRYAIAGNAPLLVERKTGNILETGTALPIDVYIANYERSGSPHG